MTYHRPVRRPDPASRNEASVDLSDGWRQFVLDQVGYDEIARERTARRADHRRAFTRFAGGLFLGLIIFALAFATMLGARSWHQGRFDRYMPKRVEAPTPPPPSARWAREAPIEASGRDTHKELQNPLVPLARAPSPDAGDDGVDEDSN